MYLELTQNEVCNIPRDREEYITVDGDLIPATQEQYIWFPIKRTSKGNQIIYVEDNADLGDLVYTECTYVDSDEVEQKTSYQSELNQQCLQYLSNTDYKIIKSQEIADYIVDAKILIKRNLCRSLIK